jgi:hypothetical protein
MNPQEEYFELYDMYFEYRELVKNLSVKIGRQKIYYGDFRIFEPSIWGNTGRWTWDAIKISYKKGENYIDVFGGGTKIHDPLKMSLPFTRTEFWGGGSYSHFSVTDWLDAEPFYALKTDGSADYIKTQSISRNWIGLRIVNPEQQNFLYDMIYAREFGKENGKRISAFGYNIKAGYRLTSLMVDPALTVQYTYASGDKKSDNVINAFDPAFGARCRFYGWMSIANWSNISYPEVVMELSSPGNMMSIEMKYNRFYVPEPQEYLLLNTMKLMDGKHHLGDEADIVIRYQPFNKWQFTGLCGYFNPGDLEMINFRDPEDAFWCAVQVLFTLN